MFEKYALYYDILYEDKDYQKEADYIHHIIKTFQPDAKKLLDLGCGTGNHARPLAEKGYNIHALELSQPMLDIAQAKLSNNIKYIQSDIRDFNLSDKFDLAYSLFHVINYQTTRHDLRAVFSNVKQHLKPDGHFIFETWYGPAVLSQKPETRVKRIENNGMQITRISTPYLDALQNCVDVHFQLFIKKAENHSIMEIQEIHRMRYLFQSDIEWLCDEYDFTLKQAFPFMSQNRLTEKDWSALFVISL